MPNVLSDSTIAQYNRDGVYFPLPALSSEEAGFYRGCLEAFERSRGGPLRGSNVELKAGQMSLHHHKVFHASPPNQAQYRRIGLAVRYIPTRVRQVAVTGDSAALVRGVDEYGHFRAEPRPERDMDPALVAMQAEAAQRQAQILYSGRGRPTFRPDI